MAKRGVHPFPANCAGLKRQADRPVALRRIFGTARVAMHHLENAAMRIAQRQADAASGILFKRRYR